MATTLKMKRGDTARKITDTLTLGGAPIDLAGSTIILVWKTSAAVARRTAAIIDPEAGTVEYQVVAEDVDTVGSAELEWEITFPDTNVLTVPTVGFIKVKISADLG
jgi:hypothetical protein